MGLADRELDVVVRDRMRFGRGAVAVLPELIREARGRRAFIVTDAGVVASGAVDAVRIALQAGDIAIGLFDEVEANPGSESVERGSAALAAFGTHGTVVVPVGGGSSIDTAKAVSLHVRNEGEVLALGYHDHGLLHGLPVVAVPTTAGTGAETNTYGVITDEAAGRKAYVGHPSVLPVASVLDPELTVGLPPAPTAATGVDALTHSLESLLSRNPNPFAEAIALAGDPDGRRVAAGCGRRTAGISRRAARCSWRLTSPGSARRAGPASGQFTRSGTRSGRVGSCRTGRPSRRSSRRCSRVTST